MDAMSPVSPNSVPTSSDCSIVSSLNSTSSSLALPHVTSWSADGPQTMLSTSRPAVPNTMLSSSTEVPQTFLSSISPVPHTMLSSSSVPHTMLSQSMTPQSVPHTMLSSMTV